MNPTDFGYQCVALSCEGLDYYATLHEKIASLCSQRRLMDI
jgi:hypothetical protein